MIASLFNLIIGIAILVGIGYATLRWILPGIKTYQAGEERARKHDLWMKEQERGDADLRKAAEQEINQEFGHIDLPDEPNIEQKP